MKNSEHEKRSCNGCIYLKLHASRVYGGMVKMCMRENDFVIRKKGASTCYESDKAKAYIKNR